MLFRLSSLVLSLFAVCLLAAPAFSAPEAQPAPGMERTASVPASATPVSEKAGSYSGNTKTRVFHASNCRYFNCKSCNEHFSSADEARKNGYKPCTRCIR